MSLFTTWINLIKERATEAWLTEHQREAYEAILNRWRTADFVNLYGAQGSGKSFIARLLANAHDYAYVQALTQAPAQAAQVVLDDAQYNRTMRPEARALGLGRVILITETPISEAMPRFELVLDERDVSQFTRALSDYCDIIFTATVPEGTDLARIIRREVVKRGENNVHQ
jgi:MoxR-like ATPase